MDGYGIGYGHPGHWGHEYFGHVMGYHGHWGHHHFPTVDLFFPYGWGHLVIIIGGKKKSPWTVPC